MLKDTAPRLDLEGAQKAVEEFVQKHPVAAILGMVVLNIALSSPQAIPVWLRGLAPVNPRTNGPWRGKGSFGTHFGPQQSGHR